VNDSTDNTSRIVSLDTAAIGGWDYGRITGLGFAAIQYQYAGTNTVTIQTGTGGATVNVLAIAVPVSLIGHGSSTVNIGNAGTVQAISGPLTISGSPSSLATVNVDDSADSYSYTVTLDTAAIGGANYGRITGLAPAAIQYKYSDTSTVTIQTGTIGDLVNVLATNAPVNLIGHGSNWVNVGNYEYSDTNAVSVQTGTGGATVNVLATGSPLNLIGHGSNTVNVGNAGSVQGINGPLTIMDPGSGATINVDDSADGTYRTDTLDAATIGGSNYGRITGLAPAAIQYKYSDTSVVTIQTGSGGVEDDVLATGSAVNLIGHGGSFVFVGNTGSVQAINAPLTVTDTTTDAWVFVDDSADTTARVVNLDTATMNGSDYGRITGLGSAPIEYKYSGSFYAGVTTGIGGGTINVLSTGVPVGLIGTGNETVNVGNAGSVQAINGGLTISGAPSFPPAVNVDDSADGTARTVNLDTVANGGSVYGQIAGLAPALIWYNNAGTSTATVQTGTGGGTVNALSTGVPVILIGNSSGPISLVASDAANTWTITGQNAGTLSSALLAGTVTFSGAANLTGGNGADTFVFANGAGVDGTIDGGGGTNALDYSAYSASVLVDLQTGFATGVGTGIANIQNVTGGNGGGAGVYNILVGNGGNVLTGGDGRRNLLIAGASASTLQGGNDDDILIGGTTAYDTEAGMVSLQAIMDYWSNTTDDYATRLANLMSGTGVPLLDATMVTNNGGGNTMMGNHGGATEMNLFYGMDPTLETTDYNPAIGEQFINR
jgi:hypothetical protein